MHKKSIDLSFHRLAQLNQARPCVWVGQGVRVDHLVARGEHDITHGVAHPSVDALAIHDYEASWLDGGLDELSIRELEE